MTVCRSSVSFYRSFMDIYAVTSTSFSLLAVILYYCMLWAVGFSYVCLVYLPLVLPIVLFWLTTRLLLYGHLVFDIARLVYLSCSPLLLSLVWLFYLVLSSSAFAMGSWSLALESLICVILLLPILLLLLFYIMLTACMLSAVDGCLLFMPCV